MILGTFVQGNPGHNTIDSILKKTCTYISNSRITQIKEGAINYNTNLISVDCPNVSNIGWGAFQSCTNLKTVNASTSGLITIGGAAFQSCTNLTSVNLNWSAISGLSTNVFDNCIKLPLSLTCYSTILAGYIFRSCRLMTYGSFPLVTSISTYAFFDCQQLSTLEFPQYQGMQSMAFEQCYNLQTVKLYWSSTATQVSNRAFSKCYNLTSLYLLGPSMIALQNINAFTSTPISNYTTSTGGVYGSIYVPESLYSSYIAAANWSTYSDRFVSLTSTEIASLIGDWTLSLSASFVGYPLSRPIYANEDIKSYISNVMATHYDSTTVALGDDFCVTGTKDWGGRLITVVGGGGRTTIPMVMAQEFELPEGYERIGYLQAPPGAYIDTGVIPNSEDQFIVVDMPHTTFASDQPIMIGAGSVYVWKYANYHTLYFGSTTRQGTVYYQIYGNSGGTLTTNQTVFTDFPYAATLWNTSTLTYTKGTNIPDYPYYVFARNNNGTPAYGVNALRIWYVEIPNRIQLIPCKRKSDNVLGMYDLMGNICSLTNTPFFINAGTGSFTYGYNP